MCASISSRPDWLQTKSLHWSRLASSSISAGDWPDTEQKDERNEQSPIDKRTHPDCLAHEQKWQRHQCLIQGETKNYYSWKYSSDVTIRMHSPVEPSWAAPPVFLAPHVPSAPPPACWWAPPQTSPAQREYPLGSGLCADGKTMRVNTQGHCSQLMWCT